MRLTVNLDEDLYVLAKSIAKSEGVSISSVLNRLLRKSQEQSSRPGRRAKSRNGFPVVRGSRPVTPELVDEIEERYL